MLNCSFKNQLFKSIVNPVSKYISTVFWTKHHVVDTFKDDVLI